MKFFKSIFIIAITLCFTCILSFSQIVTIYSETNYNIKGRSQTFNAVGDFRLTGYNVKSIKITPGYIVTMANEAGCTGLCTYWGNIAGGGGVIGAQGCSISIKRVDARNARLQVKIKTGGDDLRSGSLASFQVRINAKSPVNKRLGGPYPNQHLTEFNINIPNIRVDEILDFYMGYTSGSSGMFETTDNWNVDRVEIKYLCDNCPDPTYLTKESGAPLVRFSGEKRNHTFYTKYSSCN